MKEAIVFSGFPNIHPILVHFPIALYTTALVTDLLLLCSQRLRWLDRCSGVLYVLAASGSGLAAISGKLAANDLEPNLEPASRIALEMHSDWAFVTVILFFLVAALRFDIVWHDHVGLELRRGNRLRTLSFVVAVIAQVVIIQTSNKGGELVYRHGLGVASEEQVQDGGQ